MTISHIDGQLPMGSPSNHRIYVEFIYRYAMVLDPGSQGRGHGGSQGREQGARDANREPGTRTGARDANREPVRESGTPRANYQGQK